MRPFVFICACLLCLPPGGCDPHNKPEAGFYYWKSVFRLSAAERTALAEMRVNRLYVRFFDVDWDAAAGEARPVAPVVFAGRVPAGVAVTPVVFITNRTMTQLPAAHLPGLARRITARVAGLARAQRLAVTEIQLDCDWSGRSREAFFALVRLVRRQGVRVSVTVRLHQLRHAGSTGVPPADAGVLMCYNVGRLDGTDTRNSILDTRIVRQYVASARAYPLPLHVALPVYEWAVLLREGRPVRLLAYPPAGAFGDTARYQRLDEKNFRVRQNHYFQSTYLYPGDGLRLETVPPDVLRQTADLLQPVVNQGRPRILFYHLDQKNLLRHDVQSLQDLVRRFR